MKYINLLIILIISMLFGCNMPNDKVIETYNHSVNCILMTGNDKQKVYFTRVRDIDEVDKFGPGYYDTVGHLVFLPGAKITINNNLFHECIIRADDYSYYNIFKPGFIQPETEYNLNIEYNGETITGKTTVPGAFLILNYPKDSVYKKTGNSLTFKLVWTKSKNTKGYLIQVEHTILSDFLTGNKMYLVIYTPATYITDTTFTVNVGFPKRSIIKVAAYDENFENFYIKNHKITGLNNTYGVFCSMAVDSIVVNVEE